MANFNILPGQRQLFLDDAGVEHVERLDRTLHQPEKKGAVIRSPNPDQTIQTRSAPVWDARAEHYKLWCIGVDTPLWQSPDGLHWTPGPAHATPMSHVVCDANDPDPDRRFKAAVLGQGFAASPDGLRWQTLDVPAVESADEGNFSFDPAENRFIHTVKRSGPHGRAVAVATSTDFAHWDDHGVVFHADDRDQEQGRATIAARLADPRLQQTEYDTPEHYSVQVYNMGVFRYEGLYIGLPSMYHHTGKVPPDWPGFADMHLSPYIRECVERYGDYTGFYEIQVACSRDLQNWHRVADRRPFIETSPLGAGAYDLQTLIGPSDALVLDDELWFYYTGIKQYAFIRSGGIRGFDDYMSDRGAVCLATLRRDGFASLDAGPDEGTLTTSPFALDGAELWVNLAAAGACRVEVLGDGDEVLATSQPATGDAVRYPIEWSAGDLAALQGRTVRLRFALRDAQLYAYWFEA